MHRGGGGERRADRLDPRRRAADPQGDAADRRRAGEAQALRLPLHQRAVAGEEDRPLQAQPRSEEHTSELQSLMRLSYDVFCLKKKNLYPTTPILPQILLTNAKYD